ncbi:MAG TPA: aquaporin [Micropepsaceae bacterium]|nr:aquaporin [Micropepsaceae bacterium]
MRWRKPAAEFIGTAFLLTAVVGSGIMGQKLANGNAAIALLANSIATGAALYALIRTFGPISGAHFNPAVTLALQPERKSPNPTLSPTSLRNSGARLPACGRRTSCSTCRSCKPRRT